MNDTWSDEELKASVEAYIDMHRKEASNVAFVKTHYYSKLSEKFGRTPKSFEFRMQNISYVYSLMGRNWVSGLKPAKNVGAKNAAKIENMVADIEGQSFLKVAEFETNVKSYKSRKNQTKPNGIKEPQAKYTSISSFTRDPKVKAWVLREANGTCECCDKPSPFVSADSEPYFEIHHLKRLADGGSDTISNAIAVCPNCHRQLHYGIDKLELTESIYQKISRLVVE